MSKSATRKTQKKTYYKPIGTEPGVFAAFGSELRAHYLNGAPGCLIVNCGDEESAKEAERYFRNALGGDTSSARVLRNKSSYANMLRFLSEHIEAWNGMASTSV